MKKKKIKKVLLVLAANREAKNTVEVALEKAMASKARLTVLLVLEPGMAGNIVRLMISQGWIGASSAENIAEALRHEIAAHGQGEADRAMERAREVGVPCTVAVRQGDFAQEVLRFAEEEKSDYIVVTRRKRWPLTRVLFGSAVQAIRDGASCPVQVVDEP